MKVSELNDIALDWAVTTIVEPEALRFGVDDWRDRRRSEVMRGEYIHRYHQSWMQGGPIIEREGMLIRPQVGYGMWEAWKHGADEGHFSVGKTPLIAAMRCYVASKLGDEIEIPEELQNG